MVTINSVATINTVQNTCTASYILELDENFLLTNLLRAYFLFSIYFYKYVIEICDLIMIQLHIRDVPRFKRAVVGKILGW